MSLGILPLRKQAFPGSYLADIRLSSVAYLSMRVFRFLPFPLLLSDAEIRKDVSQDFVGGDFADDGAEVVDGFADVLGGEVGREAGGEAVADAKEGSAGVSECLNMALVGDECGVAVAEKVTLSRG